MDIENSEELPKIKLTPSAADFGKVLLVSVSIFTALSPGHGILTACSVFQLQAHNEPDIGAK